MEMNHTNAVFENSTEAVLGIDGAGRIFFTNEGCEQLLGQPRESLRGDRCADVLCGTDLHGEPLCGRDCPVRRMSEGSLPARDFDMLIGRQGGQPLLVNVGACFTRQAGGDVFLLLRPVNTQRLLQRITSKGASDVNSPASRSSRRRPGHLTKRERELLGLVSHGLKTMQIAERLNISTETVRNHCKNIHSKLNAHSRTEAVSIALRQGLI